MQYADAECTLLRSNGAAMPAPLFSEGLPTARCNDASRNSYFRYQSLQRLGNLVTTRSNVFSVWITVGYFEVTPVPGGPTPVYPDGYQLSQELGSDTGEIERHRAFYMIDRSLPVAFQPGQNNNVDRAILVKRFIE